jgi:beta-glucosidase
VLVGDAAGKPRHDFTGRLSFAWPNGPVPPMGADLVGPKAAVSQHVGWPMGYGLGYAQHAFAPPQVSH